MAKSLFLTRSLPMLLSKARRISAISIAERVGQEQCLEKAVGGLIGYQVRLDGAMSKDTQLIFLTPGILLRKLQSSPKLSEYTHIIIDEVHERDKYTEFLLITLRDLLPVRPDLRLVLMSATLQTEVLVNYFCDCDNPFYKKYPPARIEIEGRAFPVQEFFLEDVIQMTEYIDTASPQDDDGPMSMDALELELAKLMGKPENDDTDSSFQCMMCGQNFSDHVELGSHVAICNGTTANDGTAEATPIDQRGVQSDDFEDFGDYDVDTAPTIEGYGLDFPGFVVAKDDVDDSIHDGEKWDGEGKFQEGPTRDETLENRLLDQYQIMHDDETVDTTLLLEVLHYINKSSHGDGAVLVFLPGWHEISEFTWLLESTPPFNNRSKFLVLPLHSGIPSASQRRVLQRPPPGVRKIVLSTNIAETSLTIEDVAFVVDSGRSKEKNYDPHLKISTLQPTWISQASAKQRKGRAGRTKAGVCFHLFSRRRHEFMRDFVESELLRTPLVSL
jgi:ATP-dependent RNA helicase DHX36